MPKKLKTPPIPRDYLTRHELLAMVPLGMTSIDGLEKKGIFPKRFQLLPLKRVAWPRREVEAFLRLRAKRRPGQSYLGAAREDQAAPNR
jgi:predicted DNA-binding transcriptional regulator AlpA